jgi:hypothetical protein
VQDRGRADPLQPGAGRGLFEVIGSATIGTPKLSASMTVLKPACVIASAQRASKARWGT